MKLTYRGISYEYNPPEVTYGDSTQVGKYRGVDIRFRIPKEVAPVLQPTLDLIYRGVAYTSQAVAGKTVKEKAVEVNPVEASPVEASPAEASLVETAPVEATKTREVKASQSIQERARGLMMDHHRMIKQREQSMLSRLNAQVGLPADEAGRYWNHIQGKVHPTLGESYDRSHAAFS